MAKELLTQIGSIPDDLEEKVIGLPSPISVNVTNSYSEGKIDEHATYSPPYAKKYPFFDTPQIVKKRLEATSEDLFKFGYNKLQKIALESDFNGLFNVEGDVILEEKEDKLIHMGTYGAPSEYDMRRKITIKVTGLAYHINSDLNSDIL